MLAIIPARGGSKGLPRKNIKMLLGKPLVAWSIESAKLSKYVDRVIVSTDDDEIAAIAKKYGAEIEIRSPELSADDSTTIAVINSVAKKYPEYEDILVLQPTSPLREMLTIDKCFEEYKKGGYTNLATGYFCKAKEFGSHNNLRRQDYPGFFYDDGNIYILSRDLALEMRWCGDRPCKYHSTRFENYEIDDEVDFLILEALIKYKYASDNL
jgi:CMP-N-acetylneuraminic acid synthetase